MTDPYRSLGFRSNPFAQKPLPPDEYGSQLLIGRDKEVALISNRISTPPKLVTIEGANGIGKTSIVNVAGFRAHVSHLTDPTLPLYIPCRKTFQLSHDSDSETFVRDAYQHIAQTLVFHAELIKDRGFDLNKHSAVGRWLTSPLFKRTSLSLGIGGVSGGGGRDATPNTSAGFNDSGLESIVNEWLADIFPDDENGGVICTIDNLELLKTSEKARDLIETLRDRILDRTGLRWILCGATGIVYGLASTPRLSGRLHEPITVTEIQRSLGKKILSSRIESHAVTDDAEVPITDDSFETLLGILDGNIRETLSMMDNFCIFVFENVKNNDWKGDRSHKNAIFSKWIRDTASKRLSVVESVMTPGAWSLLEKIVGVGGQCAPSDYEPLGFRTPQAMRTHLLKLEAASLIFSTRDEDDSRRKTIYVTPTGWLVHHARSDGWGSLFAPSDDCEL